MSNSEEFQSVFKKLRAILEPYAKRLIVVHDTDSQYYLNTKLVMSNKQPLFFAAVRIGKAYVSFHLMPVYAHPTLAREIPAELKKRMQGKSCFNFKSVDEKVFAQLAKLTAAGFKTFQDPAILERFGKR